MFLYLVQHARAQDEAGDIGRSLSEIGRNEMRRITDYLAAHDLVQVETIYHSGKLRAEQTAELLAEVIRPTGGIKKAKGLAPMDDPGIWAGKVSKISSDIMLVGHLPHISHLASLLLTGGPARQPIHVRNGGILCLNRDPDSHWAVEWMITPAILA